MSEDDILDLNFFCPFFIPIQFLETVLDSVHEQTG